MQITRAVTLAAPPSRVWVVWSDVVRWPEWTASVTRVEPLSDGPLAVGSRYRIHQPRLPALVWEVSALEPGRGWTWIHRSPGNRSSAGHRIEGPEEGPTRVTMTVAQEGWAGEVIGRVYAGLTRRYLELEAAGLERRVMGRPG